MYAVKHQDAPALIEALIADVAMVVCSLLALGMACARAVGEGGAAAGGRLRGPVCGDELPGRRRVLGPLGGGLRDAPGGVRGVHRPDGGGDPQARPGHHRRLSLGGAAGWCSPWCGLAILLYGLRFILAPAETAKGLRRMVLNAAPLPEAGQGHPAPEAVPRGRPRSCGDPGGRSRGDPAPGPGGRPRHPGTLPGAPQVTPGKRPGPATPERVAEFYAAELAARHVPSETADQA